MSVISSVRRIFERGGPGNLKIMKTKKNFSTQNQSVFLPKIKGRPKKKGLHSILVRFLAQNYVKTKHKKLVCTQILSFCVLNFLPKLRRRWPCRNFAYYSMLIILSWRSKRGGGHGTMAPPPPKHAPECD